MGGPQVAVRGARRAWALGNIFTFKCPVSPGVFSLGFEMLQKSVLFLCVFAEENMGCIYSSFSPSP